MPGDVVIADFGCTVDGYFSDITRTFAIGSATDEHHRAYDAVLRAHYAGRAAARPGATGHEVDAAARSVLEEAGYGKHFNHRTGHGIGLRIHEEPYLTPGNGTPLVEGDCFSIEPGVYVPGRFGVRIENIVTLTGQGCESLNADPAPTLRLVELGAG
jgi:D-alanyl-D-alanine dipeptidase